MRVSTANPRLRLLVAAFAVFAALACAQTASAADSATVGFKLKGVKSSGSLAIQRVRFPASNEAEILLSGAITFKANRRTLRASSIEVVVFGGRTTASGKLGSARYTLFTATGPAQINTAIGSIALPSTAFTVPTAARNAIVKKLKLKKNALKTGSGNVAVAVAGNPPPPPAPPAPPTPPTPQPPSATIMTGPQGLTTETEPSFTFVSPDEDVSFECAMDAGSFAACTSPYASPALLDGQHIFKVRATNDIGTGSVAQRGFTLDTTAPTITIDGTLNSSTVTSTIRSIPFTVNETSTVTCRIDSAPFAACSSPYLASNLAMANHQFQVNAVDAAGNSATATANFDVLLVVDLCGTITSDRTLSPDEAYVYRVTCDVTVAAGVELTMSPSTHVKFEDGTKLVVNGELDINGEWSQGVILTSVHDTEYTGHIGSEPGTPEPGDWGGIVSRPGSNASVEIEIAEINFATTGVDFEKQATDDANLKIENGEFNDLSKKGVEFDVASGPIVNMPAPTITDSYFSHTGEAPIDINSPRIDQTQLSNNHSTNSHGGLELAGTLVGNGQLASPEMQPVVRGITIAEDARLDIYEQTWKVALNRSIVVEGELDGDKAVFTSINDNGEGEIITEPNETNAEPAFDWNGIITNPGSDSTIDLHQGAILFAKAGVQSEKSAADFGTLTLDTVTIRHMQNVGVDVELPLNANPASPPPTIRSNQIWEVESGPGIELTSPEIDHTLLNNNICDETDGKMMLSGTLVGTGGVNSDGCIPIADGVTVGSTATLEIGESQVWAVMPNRQLTVNGVLEVNGTATDFGYITSARDTEHGDLLGDSSSTAAAPGDWNGIVTSPGSNSTIDIERAAIAWAKTGISSSKGGSDTSHFEVHHTVINQTTGNGISYVANPTIPSSSSTPAIHNNSFDHIGLDAIVIDSPSIDQTLLGDNYAGDLDERMSLAGTLTGIGAIAGGGSIQKEINGLTVSPSAAFVLNPGDVYYGNPAKSLVVKGTLETYFPDPGDPAAELIDASGPPAWNGVIVDGGHVDLYKTKLTGGTTVVTLKNGATGNFADCIITGATAMGINVQTYSNATYRGLIDNHSGGGANATADGTSYLDATSTFWGAADGPYPTGNGGAVTGNVDYLPFLAAPPF